jgi:hypothetical protein
VVRHKFVVRDGKVVPKAEAAPLERPPEVYRTFQPFTSTTLPLNYPYHKGPFTKDGKCRFESARQVRDTLTRAQHAGEMVEWDRMTI